MRGRSPTTDYKAPLVSVIIPTFDAASTLEETLRSALAQTYRRIEVIVADDGSTDASVDIANSFTVRDARVRVLPRHHRSGPAAARNRAIAAARGSYIAPLDADDLWHPAKIERQIEAAQAQPHADFVYTFCLRIDGEGRVMGYLDACAVEGPALGRHLYMNFASTSSILFRREALLAVGGYEERLARSEDYITQVRVAVAGDVAVVPLFLVGYRAVPGSQSSNREDMFASWLKGEAMLLTEHPDLPRRPRRWSKARRLLQLAEYRAYKRRLLPAVSPLLGALRRDPVRSLLYLGHLLTRQRRNRAAVGDHFHLFDPATGIEPMLLEGTTSRSLLRRFEARRLEALRKADMRAARRSC